MSELLTHPVVVRGISIGEGIPKICVPIVGGTIDAVSSQAARIVPLASSSEGCGKVVDLVEWRADGMPCVTGETGLLAAQTLRTALPDTPILFTFRSKQEGGEQELSREGYLKLAISMIDSGYIDIVDLELSMGEEIWDKAVTAARQRGVKVLGSSHDFSKTPSLREMVSKFARMEALGADILKIAVMPQGMEDVLRLLSAAVEMGQRTPCPIVAISMSELGAATRLCGGFFGSAITFGALERASAPGQTDAVQLRRILDILPL